MKAQRAPDRQAAGSSALFNALLSPLTEFDQLPNKHDPAVQRNDIPRIAGAILSIKGVDRLLGVSKLESLLAAGANGLVFAARTDDGREAVVKLTRPFTPQVKLRYRDENQFQYERETETLQILNRGNVPHVVRLLSSKLLSDPSDPRQFGAVIQQRAPDETAPALLQRTADRGGSFAFCAALYADLLEVATGAADLRIALHDLDLQNALVQLNPRGLLKATTVVDFGDSRPGLDSVEEALEETLQESLKPQLILSPRFKPGTSASAFEDLVNEIEIALLDLREGLSPVTETVQKLRRMGEG